MSDGVAYADIIILALIAGFILLRLRSVLGQQDDSDAEAHAHPAVEQEKIVHIRDPKPAAPAEDAPEMAIIQGDDDKEAFRAIATKDASVTIQNFIAGSKMAFEMVFDAFEKGDKSTLKSLLSKELYEHFSGAVDDKKERGEQEETTLLSVRPAAISGVELSRSTAQITVEFVSEQVSVTRDKGGEVIDGNVSATKEVKDSWTFERNITAKDPNWRIVET